MNKDKQIEEMAKVIAKADDTCRAKTIAKALYNADYRKLSENVIELPCKVGDTVYMPWEYKGVSSVAILTVTHVIIDEVHSYIRTNLKHLSDSEDYLAAYNYGRFDFRELGEKVFTSKEEAAQALEKLIQGVL